MPPYGAALLLGANGGDGVRLPACGLGGGARSAEWTGYDDGGRHGLPGGPMFERVDMGEEHAGCSTTAALTD